MLEDVHWKGERTVLRTVTLALGVGYALLAATTTPFTTAANVVTAGPIVLMAVLVLIEWPARPGGHPTRMERERDGRPLLAWVVVLVVFVAWELAEYLVRGSRAAHPTFSSMVEAADRTYVAKVAVVFCWLWLGVAIARAGTPHPSSGLSGGAERS